MFRPVYVLFSSLWTFLCHLLTPWKRASTDCVASSGSLTIDIEVGVEVTQVVELPVYLHSLGPTTPGTPEVSDGPSLTHGEPYPLTDAMGCHGTTAASNGSISDEADRSRDSIHSTSTNMTSSSQDTFFEEHSFESVTSLDGPSDEGIQKCPMDLIVHEGTVGDHLVLESYATENTILENKTEDINADGGTELLETKFNEEQRDEFPVIIVHNPSLGTVFLAERRVGEPEVETQIWNEVDEAEFKQTINTSSSLRFGEAEFDHPQSINWDVVINFKESLNRGVPSADEGHKDSIEIMERHKAANLVGEDERSCNLDCIYGEEDHQTIFSAGSAFSLNF